MKQKHISTWPFSAFPPNTCLKPAALSSARITMTNLGEPWGIITCCYSPAATLPPRGGHECTQTPVPSACPARGRLAESEQGSKNRELQVEALPARPQSQPEHPGHRADVPTDALQWHHTLLRTGSPWCWQRAGALSGPPLCQPSWTREKGHEREPQGLRVFASGGF